MLPHDFDYCSDLHLDFDGGSARVLESFAQIRSPVLILAGDIVEVSVHTGAPNAMQDQVRNLFQWVSARYEHILYVVGNHEYYGCDLNLALDQLRAVLNELGCANVRVLENETVDIGDISYFGATMWTSCRRAQPLVMNAVQSGMADYKHIRKEVDGQLRCITAEDTITLHQAATEALDAYLQAPTQKRRVIITHHAPHLGSIAPFYRRHSLTDAYFEEMFDVIHDSDVEVWIHGHTHHTSDYRINKTRILANPRGYYGSESTYRFHVKGYGGSAT